MGPRSIVLAIVCVVLVIAAVVITVRRQSAAGPPQAVLEQKVQIVTVDKPFTVREITVGDKAKLAKDTATGYYKLDGKLCGDAHKCISCGATIPAAVVPPDTERPADILTKYKCPKCGKAAYEAP